jgi:hypothetical protein
MIKRAIPKTILKVLRRIKYNRRNADRSVRDVFTEVYIKGEWGTRNGRFCSGPGSATDSITQPYIKMIIEFLQSIDQEKTVVDLGCGDFEIGKHFIPYCSEYIGVDIVPNLIEKHELTNWGEHVKFICSDIIADDLPDGDICFLRQVLQHLSNDQIAKILPKLKKYKVIFITEDYPKNNKRIVPNKNMVHGSRIRAFDNSAVYLDKPPFNIPSQCLEMVLEVPVAGLSQEYSEGLIRTYKLIF